MAAKGIDKINKIKIIIIYSTIKYRVPILLIRKINNKIPLRKKSNIIIIIIILV